MKHSQSEILRETTTTCNPIPHNKEEICKWPLCGNGNDPSAGGRGCKLQCSGELFEQGFLGRAISQIIFTMEISIAHTFYSTFTTLQEKECFSVQCSNCTQQRCPFLHTAMPRKKASFQLFPPPLAHRCLRYSKAIKTVLARMTPRVTRSGVGYHTV